MIQSGWGGGGVGGVPWQPADKEPVILLNAPHPSSNFEYLQI